MQVICTDGTTFSCEGYELTEYGIRLYGQEQDPDPERYDEDPEPVAYIPHDQLRYVLPDGVQPNAPVSTATQNQQPMGAAPPNSQPPAGPAPTEPSPRSDTHR